MTEHAELPRRRLVQRQKAAAEKLRREVLEIDGSRDHPYFRDLRRHLGSFDRPVDWSEVAEACGRADLVYVGDFHAVAEYQRCAADLLEEIVHRAGGAALGIEFVYTRQQRWLDARQKGDLDDASFLRRIHYREEWGYPWSGFGRLLDRARNLSVPVYALDAPPRGGFDGLPRRDDHAARRIAALMDEIEVPLVVLFGESHVSRGHVPRRVETRLRRSGRQAGTVTVFQNPDGLYWKLLESGDDMPRAVCIDDATFAVFHTSPLAKYEAYRQVLERWQGDVPPEEEVDLTPAVHHLIHVLLGWLGIRPDRFRLKHRAGWAEDLSDAFPEVYSGAEATDLLVPILREYRRTDDEIGEATERLGARGALYEPRSNTLFLQRYLPGRAAGEGARFLRAALTGRLFEGREENGVDPAARAYGAAYNEALAYLGSRLVDPASDYLSGDEVRALSAVAGSTRVRPSPTTFERARWLERHTRFERGRSRRIPENLLEPLRHSRTEARLLAYDLGHRLGRLLFEQVCSGRLDRRGLRRIFSRPLAPAKAPAVVLQLLRS